MPKRKKPENIDDGVVKELINDHKTAYDTCNQFVLPGKKKKNEKQKIQVPGKTKKPLTRKQKKRLETIIQSKAKKAKRKELLEKLAEIQASNDHLRSMISNSAIPTKGLKRHFPEKINSIKKNKNKKGRKVEVQSASESSEEDSDENSDEETEIKNELSDENNQNDKEEIEEVSIVESKITDEVETNENKVEVVETNENKVEVVKLETENSLINAEATVSHKPAVFVPVYRTDEIQESRLKLPILAEEQTIMETINENSIVVLCGETGSGKTTQVPQFLYEAGYARTKMIAVTEPRRVAAISMSRRVAEEMNLPSDEVSYQIRYEGNVTDKSKIKFMTDGVLLKEIQKDANLSNYSVIIIDEAHERSVYTDVLIGLLSRIVPNRNKKGDPLKLIIMSATLRVEDFTENLNLFKIKPPVINIAVRQFEVTVHWLKQTPIDYAAMAYNKICKIHRNLPAGGILVFVTGRQEVNILCSRLSRTFPFKQKLITETENDDDEAMRKFAKGRKKRSKKKPALPQTNLDDFSVLPFDMTADAEEFSDDDEAEDITDDFSPQFGSESAEPLYVLPLFSLLSSAQQSKVFKPPPEGCRLCVVATNVAETSLTIPNIKYVVDTGKVKTRFYDKTTGVSTFLVTNTSKASADQRAGRAGRMGPGHCYRLYSTAVFNDSFQRFSEPEICRKPIDDLVLQMKDMGIHRVVNFPFPSTPDTEALKASERRLCLLGALEDEPTHISFQAKKNQKPWTSGVTELGHTMACFPVGPCYAKMLALGNQQDLLPYIICIVAALTVQELLLVAPITNTSTGVIVSTEHNDILRQRRLKWAGKGQSELLGDVMVLLKAVGAAEFGDCSFEFCSKHGINHKAILEVRKLRSQLTNTINLEIPDMNLCVDPKMQPPNEFQVKLLRQMILTAFPHHVAKKQSEIKENQDKNEFKRAYECTEIDDFLYIDASSIFYEKKLKKTLPEFIVYQQIEERHSKIYMKGITVIEPQWLPLCAPKMCSITQQLDEPKPRYDLEKDQLYCFVKSTFGPKCWELPCAEVKFPIGENRYRWFAAYFLEGEVCPLLRQFVPLLRSQPTTITKSWANLQKHTKDLYLQIRSKNVDSKEGLIRCWKEDKNYLLDQYLEWFAEETVHLKIRKLWPPVEVKKLKRMK